MDLPWTKWRKHKVLSEHEELESVLPETMRMKKSSFVRMLEKHRKIVAKPNITWGGLGIMFISRSGDDRYLVQSGRTTKEFEGIEAAWSYVCNKKHDGAYLLQKYIPLATIENRPFDIRVMVQRKRNSPWTVTGKVAKIAGSGYLITNARRSRGTVDTVPNAIKRSSAATSSSITHMCREMDDIALTIADKLTPAFPSIRKIGLDLGIDRKGGIWLIEANFIPSNVLFLKLKDKSMYRKIISYR